MLLIQLRDRRGQLIKPPEVSDGVAEALSWIEPPSLSCEATTWEFGGHVHLALLVIIHSPLLHQTCVMCPGMG